MPRRSPSGPGPSRSRRGSSGHRRPLRGPRGAGAGQPADNERPRGAEKVARDHAQRHLQDPQAPRNVPAKARSQAICLHELASLVMREKKPADRLLGAHFRANRKYGSSDRRQIGETFFALFRWWGWVRHLTNAGERLWQRDSHLAGDDRSWLRLLFAAQWLEATSLPPLAAHWKHQANVHEFVPDLGGLPLRERAERFAKTFELEPLATTELLPDWLAGELPGQQLADAFIESQQRRPPLWLRAQSNPGKLLRELRQAGLEAEPSAALPAAIAVREARLNLQELPAYASGRVEVQDLASQIIGLACGAQPRQRWWDACAGAGGKSLQLARQMDNTGTLIATDVRAWKLQDLRKRARRAGLHNITPREWDGQSLPGREANFDGVLVDAPCSCSGTWRRNPALRWTSSPEDVAEMAQIQRRILHQAARGVKPGGVLIYATCSLCRAENEAVAGDFAEHHPAFTVEPLTHPLTGRQSADGFLRVWPHEGDSDAVFVARFRKPAK